MDERAAVEAALCHLEQARDLLARPGIFELMVEDEELLHRLANKLNMNCLLLQRAKLRRDRSKRPEE